MSEFTWRYSIKMTAQRPDFVSVWDLVVRSDGYDLAEARSLLGNRSQCFSQEDGI